jgi:hypothetical protein
MLPLSLLLVAAQLSFIHVSGGHGHFSTNANGKLAQMPAANPWHFFATVIAAGVTVSVRVHMDQWLHRGASIAMAHRHWERGADTATTAKKHCSPTSMVGVVVGCNGGFVPKDCWNNNGTSIHHHVLQTQDVLQWHFDTNWTTDRTEYWH